MSIAAAAKETGAQASLVRQPARAESFHLHTVEDVGKRLERTERLQALLQDHGGSSVCHGRLLIPKNTALSLLQQMRLCTPGSAAER